MIAPNRDFAQLTAALGDRYLVERELGHGGMATVYLAQDIKHARPVAIKVLRPELYSAQFAERFLAEIRVTASLQHPHILPLFDSGASGELLYYVMPYVTGETLRERITREHQLPIADAVRIAGDVAGALDYAHRRGVIHRDIKPENILFNDGAAMVADFGIAYSVAANTGAERLTATGISIGTPTYMSPEQASGERTVDARSDVYALGAVLYEMLAGTPPHTGSSAQAIMAKVLTTDPAPIATLRREVSPTLTAVVTRALSREPDERWDSAAALAHALQERTTSGQSKQVTRPHTQRRTRVILGGMALVAAASVGFTTWRFRARADAPPTVTSKRQVTFNGSVENVALSPDGRFLVYAAHGEDSLFVFSQDLDGGGNAIRLAAMANADVLSLEWSPNGTKILLTGVSGTTPLAYLIPPLGGELRRLSVESLITGIVPFGAWLPDGERVAFWPHADHRLAVFGTQTGDTSSMPLTGFDDTGQGHWSTNGLVVAQQVDSKHEIWVIPPKGAPLRLASNMSLGAPRWSTRRDAVFAMRGLSDLVRFPLHGLSIAGAPQVVAAGLEAWGHEIQFTVSALSLSADDRRAVYTRLVQHANVQLVGRVGAIRPLTATTTIKRNGTLSPDGTRLAFVQRTARADNVWVLDLATSTARQLTFGDVFVGTTNSCLAWSPDGTTLAFVQGVGGVPTIGIVSANGTGTVAFVPGTENDGGGIAWTPAHDITFTDSSTHEMKLLDPVSRKVRVTLSDSSGGINNGIGNRDGSRVAYYNMATDPARSGLWVGERGAAPRQLSNTYLYPIGWSDDGMSLIARSGSSRDIMRVSLDGTMRVIARAPTRGDWCEPAGGKFPNAFVCTTPVSVSDAWLLELAQRKE